MLLDETTGVPGYDYEFDYGQYDPVPSSNLDLYFDGYYDGNAGHTVYVQQWDFTNTTWDILGTITDQVAEQNYKFYLFDDADHISSGNVRIRFYHVSAGSPLHELHINKLYLQLGGPSPSASASESPSESASLSPSSSASASESASLSPSSSVSPSPSSEAFRGVVTDDSTVTTVDDDSTFVVTVEDRVPYNTTVSDW